MSDDNKKWCQNPKCPEKKNSNQIRGTKGQKFYQSNTINYGYGGKNFCTLGCYNDWSDIYMDRAIDTLGIRIVEPVKLSMENSWDKRREWNYSGDGNDTDGHYLENKLRLVGNITIQYSKQYLVDIPIIKAKKEEPFIEKAEQMLILNIGLQETSSKFQRTLQRKLEGLENLPKKLENWYELAFTDFINELKKKKIALSLGEEAEWEDYFLVEQQKALAIKSQINQTDKEIDAMVYKLYDITDEEIAIVENS